MNKYEAVELAGKMLLERGFRRHTISNQSEAEYWIYPGRSETLRVAAHKCRHPFGVAATLTFEYRESWERDEDRLAYPSDESEIVEEVNLAVERYLASAELSDDDDEEDE